MGTVGDKPLAIGNKLYPTALAVENSLFYRSDHCVRLLHLIHYKINIK
jgi:hypothetical protein